MRIEWDESVRRYGVLEFRSTTEDSHVRTATVDDLRRACEAAGLTLASAQHAEDLAKLGREMAGVVVQRDEARRAAREYDSLVDSVRTALCASMSECTDVAARRVAGERDLARAERDKYFQACENWRKLDAPLSEFRRVLRVGDYESTLDAARRMSRELEVCLGQLDHVMAREKSIQLEAYALGRKSAEDRESERKELVAARDETYGNMKALCDGHVEAYAVLGAKIGESLLGAARRVVAERDAARAIRDEAIARAEKAEALHSEAEGQIACRNELRARIAELEARAEKAEAELEAARASASLVTMVGDIGVRNSGDATRLEAILAERDALAAELAAIRAATGEDPTDDSDAGADRAAVLALARHVRAERPACLVARAVALGCDVRVIAGDMRCGVHVKGGKIDIMASTRTADVPATLARLLDEVEAARKGGAK